jgi:hypothetical protein
MIVQQKGEIICKAEGKNFGPGDEMPKAGWLGWERRFSLPISLA